MLLFPSSRLGTKTCHSVSLDQMGQISGSDTGSSHVGFWDMPHIREKYIYILPAGWIYFSKCCQAVLFNACKHPEMQFTALCPEAPW